jgi:hypothetical protein
MALPYSRNNTYAGLSQIRATDLNALQDWIVNLFGGKHSRAARASPLHGRTHTRVAGASTQVDGLIKFTAGMQEEGVPIEDLQIGETLKTVRVRVMDDGTDRVLCSVKRFDASNTETTIVTGQSNLTAGWEWVALTVDTTVAEGDRFLVTVKNGEPMGAGTGNMYAASLEVKTEWV